MKAKRIQPNWKELTLQHCVKNQLPPECIVLIGLIESMTFDGDPLKMHEIQKAILLMLENNEGEMPLHYRGIARQIDEKYPEKIKYHLQKLEVMGMIKINHKKKLINLVK